MCQYSLPQSHAKAREHEDSIRSEFEKHLERLQVSAVPRGSAAGPRDRKLLLQAELEKATKSNSALNQELKEKESSYVSIALHI